MTPFTLQDDLALARVAVANADLVSLARFRAQDLVVTTKPDRTPVTDADQAVERVIRATLSASRPEDDIFGEEMGTDSNTIGARPGRQWIIDPIDGTAGFLRGLPIWGTLVALASDGVPVVGAISAPALGKRWFGATGLGSWSTTSGSREEVPLQVSEVGAVADATVSYNSIGQWVADGRQEALLALTGRAWRTRALGDFWPYMLVAEGSLDMAGEPDLQPYDMAAIQPIVEGAGGRFSSLDGENSVWTGSALATNGLIHDEVLSLAKRDQA
ncbi:MAG: histidinol phosphatase [Pontimonas sp.]|nr:histidinol phosphatase [Pontimonas sp.]